MNKSFKGDIDSQYHLISYCDNGIGFDQKYEETVFRIFSKLHNHAEYEGSGIGLALCNKIMQTHNGFIKAHGNPGLGACFDLYFPA